MQIKKIITIVVTALIVGMTALSGIMKLIPSAENTAMLEAIGFGQYGIWLGLAEIVFAALFVFPKTMRLGFILLSCYFAGALAINISYNQPPFALITIVLVWLSAYLRDKSIFFSENKEASLRFQSEPVQSLQTEIPAMEK